MMFFTKNMILFLYVGVCSIVVYVGVLKVFLYDVEKSVVVSKRHNYGTCVMPNVTDFLL